MKCPKCNKVKAAKNGRTHNGKRRYRCKDKKCGRQFVKNPVKKMISGKTWDEVDKIRRMFNLEPRAKLIKLIVKHSGISKVWIYHYFKMGRKRIDQTISKS